LGLFIGELGAALYYGLLEGWFQDGSLFVNLEEDAEGKSAAFALESHQLNQFWRHHVDGLVGEIGRAALRSDFLSIDEVVKRGYIRDMDT
jgi:hypothetical protein